VDEWGIFDDQAADYSAEEAIEADFYNQNDAEEAIRDRYSDEDGLYVHRVEEPEEDEDDPEDEKDEFWSESFPVKY
jgi:alkylated DNA repair dioxygenase AlkB